MSHTKDYKEYITKELVNLNIKSKPMMGGYLFYHDNTYFGGIYEQDNFLIKKTKNNEKYHLKEEIPYKGAKQMYLIEDLDNIELVEEIIKTTCQDLKK